MKQLYLLPLSLILMIQGFGNDPLLNERDIEDLTGTVILAPDEAFSEPEQAQKILSLNTEKFNFDDSISYDEYDDSDYGYDDDQDDLSFDYDEEQDESFISIDAPPSPDEVPPVPKSQKLDPVPAKEGASYGIPDLPPPATPKSQKAAPAPAKEASTYGKPVNPSPTAPRGSSQQGSSQPERKLMPEEASAPRRAQQPQTARQAQAQRKQQAQAPRSSSQ
ncbi:MAG: hypothetical protein JSR39_07495, partial [Verrucomicrobia bacterium]|nr:hypothetical protein [Verrucomicrobiota bacterium]